MDAQKTSITCIENLSNDLLLDVFDYLNGCELYESFWNLNARFQDLLMFSSYPLRVSSFHFGIEHPSDCWVKFIYPNRHRIISLHFLHWNTTELFFESINIDQSFHRLESLVLFPAKLTDLISLIKTLTSLPCLYSLDLSTIHDPFVQDLREIYELIFGLPVLKYLRFYSKALKLNISPRNKDNNRCSTIECIHIDHPCRFDHLMILLSYTPHLRRLILKEPLHAEENIGNKVPVTLSNLHYIFIPQTFLSFDQFEPFIMNICSQLRVMRIVTDRDSTYLDANRWEQLISKHLPYLQKFYFEYHEYFHNQLKVGEYHRLIPQFMSLFWIKRQWIFALKTMKDWEEGENEIIYSISSNKRKWYDLPETFDVNQSKEITRHSERRADEASIEPYISTELTTYCFVFQDIIPLLAVIRITALHVVDSEITARQLINMINHLPNLDTLSVFSILLEKSEYSLLKEINPPPSTINQNKITKVNFWNLTNLAEIQFLLDLCPVVKYLMIKYWSRIDCKLLVRSILTHNISNTPYLRTMGLFINWNIEKTIEELHEMIYVEELTCEYTIKYIDDRIYIQWK